MNQNLISLIYNLRDMLGIIKEMQVPMKHWYNKLPLTNKGICLKYFYRFQIYQLSLIKFFMKTFMHVILEHFPLRKWQSNYRLILFVILNLCQLIEINLNENSGDFYIFPVRFLCPTFPDWPYTSLVFAPSFPEWFTSIHNLHPDIKNFCTFPFWTVNG